MYIEEAYKGKHETWRYLIGFLAIFVGWQIIGMVPLVAVIFAKVDSLQNLPTDVQGMTIILGSNLFLFLMLLSFAIALVATFLTVRFVHEQGMISLTTSRAKIDWKRVSFAFWTWALVSIILTMMDVLLSPEDYELNFKLGPFLILMVIAIVLIPFQTSFEEYFMRGYLMQGIGILAKNRWVPLLFTSTIFGLLHVFNPEVEKLGYGIMVFYIGTGFFLGILTLMDEGLELALGFHFANNLTGALLLTSDWSAFQTDSIYKDISDPKLGWDILVPVFVIYPILLYVFSKKYGWKNWTERLTGKIVAKETFLAQNVDRIDVS